MGAWGAGGFENDDASDLAWELESAEDTSILDHALAAINNNEGHVEAPDCSVAIAAAEVVAALRMRPAAGLPEDVAKYVARIGGPPSPDLIASSLRALQRIKTNSELQELWDESDSGSEWRELVSELEARLA